MGFAEEDFSVDRPPVAKLRRLNRRRFEHISPKSREGRLTGQLNSLDKKLDWRAHTDEFMCGLQSFHYNYQEDRKFRAYACAWPKYKSALSPMTRSTEYETSHCNKWDGNMDCKCRRGYAVVGLFSEHSNHYEDRRWKLRCGKISGITVTSRCNWEGYVNGHDGWMNWVVPKHDKVVTGMGGSHNNHKEDRKYKFYVCHITTPKHQCDRVDIKITSSEQKDGGVAKKMGGAEWVNNNCENESKLTAVLEKSLKTKVSVGGEYSFAKSLEKTFDLGISVKATATVGANVFGQEASFSASFGVKTNWKTSDKSKMSRVSSVETVEVDTIKAGVSTVVKPYNRNVFKSFYKISKGSIKWKGVATCFVGETAVQTKPVSGVWKGDVVTTISGGYTVEKEQCGSGPVATTDCSNKTKYAKYCETWAERGFCKGKFAEFLLKHCPAQCHEDCVAPDGLPTIPSRRKEIVQ